MTILEKFTITGDPVTKKNHRPIWRNRRTGVPMLGKSSKLASAEEIAHIEIRNQRTVVGRICSPVAVQFLFYRKTRRRCDLSNLYELPQDALVSAGVIEDDVLIESHDGSRKLYDPKNPRTEITISLYTDTAPK